VGLDLQPIEIFSDDVVIVAASMVKGVVENRPIDRPDLILLEGTVTGIEDSEVFLSISPVSSNGWIRIRDRQHMIATDLEDPKRRAIIYDLNALPEAFVPTSVFTCDGGLDVPGVTSGTARSTHQHLGGTALTEYRVALDSDTEYLQNLFGGSINEAVAYAQTLVAATNTILVRDVQSRLKISYIRIWEENDPWFDTNTVDQLYAFREAWNQDMSQVDRNLAHLLSGRPLGGGVASCATRVSGTRFQLTWQEVSRCRSHKGRTTGMSSSLPTKPGTTTAHRTPTRSLHRWTIAETATVLNPSRP
jgi:hypothetical protein